MLGIVGIFAGFGVLNTMLMAVFERTHELGVLASLGLRPPLVLAMVLAECASLAAVGHRGRDRAGRAAAWPTSSCTAGTSPAGPKG